MGEMQATTILVADDEAEVRDLVRQVLEPCGFAITEAGNGREVLRAMEQAPVDLVILDLVMPDMEGIETLRRLRKVRPKSKILVVSGAFGGGLLHCAKLLGAQAAMKKPFSCDALITQVREVLES